MHSGMTGLADITYNHGVSTVIILDNSITGMTGHQQNPTTGYDIHNQPAYQISLEAVCRALGVSRVVVVDPADLKALEAAVRAETPAEEPSVIIARRPCALLKGVKAKPPVHVEHQQCIACRKCFQIGCPGHYHGKRQSPY